MKFGEVGGIKGELGLVQDLTVELGNDKGEVTGREGDADGADMGAVDVQQHALAAMTHGNVFRFYDEVFFQQLAGNGAHRGRAEARQVDEGGTADGAQVVDHI